VNVRVIAATNRQLTREVERGRFRADLYHRLAVYPIRVPPLRERREDVPALARHFADLTARRLGLTRVRLDDDALGRLAAASWPGNVRELENVVSRAVLRAAAAADEDGVTELDAAHLDIAASAPVPADNVSQASLRVTAAPLPLRDRVLEFERRAIRMAVERHGGNWAAAARELGMHRSNLHHLARRLGVGEVRPSPSR
jgi:anaerobic nitric oxide reductase transcription regulator